VKFIGEYLGTIEEFLPMDGTYVEDGKIYTSVIGDLVQKGERKGIRCLKIPKINVGSVVLAEIDNVKKNFGSAIIRKILGYKQNISFPAKIFVSEISDTYIDDAGNFLGVGDIIKAKVVKNEKNLINLSIKGGFGVVKAFCKVCRHELVLSMERINSHILVCPVCKRRETRKIADDYGIVKDIFL